MKKINGFENYYITECGKIFNSKTNQVMSTKKVGQGYEGINLWNGKKHITKYIHRLVAEYFVPNTNNYPEVNHKDGNKWNNKASNLEWCSVSYNRKHCRRVLKHNLNTLKLYYDNGMVKEYNFCKECAEELNIKYTTLMNFLNGHRKKPQNLQNIIFEYKGNKI